MSQVITFPVFSSFKGTLTAVESFLSVESGPEVSWLIPKISCTTQFQEKIGSICCCTETWEGFVHK